MILEKRKNNKLSLRAHDRSRCVQRQYGAKEVTAKPSAWLFAKTQFSKYWIYLQEHVVVGFNSSCYDIHWEKRTC